MWVLRVFAVIASATAHSLDDKDGLGLRWEGVGAISGGGATTKLLMDYPAAAVSDILDFLFKPSYGLNLQILKVELGGDTDATEGAEPSHMHYKGDENYNRGYEWWLMKEAKARNPDIKLYGLPWGWPGWLDPSATPDDKAVDPFADAGLTANYTLAWLLGAKREHNLTVDYIGQWNERDAPEAYQNALRAAVAGSDVAGSTTVLNRLPHYPGTTNVPDSKGCTQFPWNTTDGSRWVDEEGSIYDGRSARCLARCVNRNYISGCQTATFQWHLVSAFYDYLPWSRCGVVVANQPWSGAYEVTSPTWALAHTTQFNPVGWRYAAHGSGVDMLAKGGSMVTRVSPNRQDFSIVIEKMSSRNSNCARGSNPEDDPHDEDIIIELKGSFLKAADEANRVLQVWYSNLSSSNMEGANPPDDQLFQKLSPITVTVDGTIKLTVRVEEIYTITTLNTGAKGWARSPPATSFPLPFVQTFDNEVAGTPPKIWYDQMGAWEIQHSPYNDGHGKVMRQVAPVWPACWGYSCTGPTTFFGPAVFSGDLVISMNLRLEDHAAFTLSPEGGNGAALTLDSRGKWSLGEKSGSLDFVIGQWHDIAMRLADGWQTAIVNGAILVNRSVNVVVDSTDTCGTTAFPFNLTGTRYNGLSAGPASATTEEQCRQSCCDAGPQCKIYQFWQNAPTLPKCWLGEANSYVKDHSHNYVSRGRDLPGWYLKVSLSRYIFASIDNFKISSGVDRAVDFLTTFV